MTPISKLLRKTAQPSGPDCIRFSDGANLGPCTVWTGYKDDDGYGVLRHNGKHVRAHRLMWLAKVSDPVDLHVLHHCDNPSCVNIKHLWLGTNDDNVKDKVVKERSLIGERNSSSKLNADAVREIRILLKSGMTQQMVAVQFGVSRSCIKDIFNSLTWTHVT